MSEVQQAVSQTSDAQVSDADGGVENDALTAASKETQAMSNDTAAPTTPAPTAAPAATVAPQPQAGKTAQSAPNGAPPAADAAGETPPRPQSFDQWLGGQDDYTRALITGHITGLRSALESERGERKALAKQVKDYTAKADESAGLRSQLDTMTADLEAVNRRITFYETAPAEVANLRLAWLAAVDAGCIGADGKVDWGKLKEQAPELFRRPLLPPGNAGSGAQQTGQPDRSMNAFIRQAAGKAQ